MDKAEGENMRDEYPFACPICGEEKLFGGPLSALIGVWSHFNFSHPRLSFKSGLSTFVPGMSDPAPTPEEYNKALEESSLSNLRK